MSKGDELYVRKSRSSDGNMMLMSDSEDQMWDDSSMTAAYDKAVNKANAEIAKEIAMQTNTKIKGNSKINDKKGKAPAKSLKPKEESNGKPKQWKEGMFCRTKYYEDDVEYEAVITAVLDDLECVVKFIGFENSEIVNKAALKETRGDEARTRQVEQATSAKLDNGFESQSNDETAASERTGLTNSQNKGKKKKKQQKHNNVQMPVIPDLLKLKSALTGPMPEFRLPNMPFPPPPPPSALQMSDPEDQALSSMLISWYMSGYHTGLYQGLKRSKDNRRHHHH